MFLKITANYTDIVAAAISKNLSLFITGTQGCQIFAFDITIPRRIVHACETNDLGVVSLTFLDQLPAFVASYVNGKVGAAPPHKRPLA